MANGGTVTFKFNGDSAQLNKAIKSVSSGLTKCIGIATKVTTAASSAVSAFAGYALKVGSDFEAGMSEVSAISGATGKDLEQLKNKAMEMGATTKFSAIESAEALKYMAMAGWKTQDMTSGLAGIMNLAAAAGEDLATTSDIVTDALTAFGMKASESSHFADILAVASSNANTNVSMMGETFKYVAPIAGSLGYSAEDTALAIGLMANAGVKASQAGTSLRSIMSRLATDTGGARTQMEKLGIAVVNSDGTMRDFGRVMVDLRKKFKKLSAEEQSNCAKTIAGQEALSGFLAIVNSSDTDFEKLQKSIISCDGAAEKMADTMNDNLKGQVTLMKSNVESLGLAFYEKLEIPAKNAVKGLNNSVSELSKAFENKGIGGFASELGKQLSKGLMSISEEIPKFADMGLKVISSFISGLNTQESMSSISTTLTNLVNGFANALPTILPQMIQLGINLATSLIKGLADSIPTSLPKVVEALLLGFATLTSPENIQKMTDSAVQLIYALIEGLVNSIPVLIGNADTLLKIMTNVLSGGQGLIRQVGIQLIWSLIRGILGMGSDLVKNIDNLMQKGLNKIREFKKFFLNIGRDLIQGLINGIIGMKDRVVSNIKGVANSALNTVKGIFGIHSPSTEFAWIGKMNILGLEKGMEDMKGDLNTTFDDMMNLSPTLLANASNTYSPNVNVVVNNSFEQDPLGQMVQTQKTFSSGSKNDYNFGMGV